MGQKLTATLEPEGEGYLAVCPELGIARQGNSIEEAQANLQDALEEYFETASFEEITQRLTDESVIPYPDMDS